jgi:hypothetical protein
MDAEVPSGNTALAGYKLVRLANKPEARVSHKELAKQAKKTKLPARTPKTLALSELHVAPIVFQWRHGHNSAARESALHTLALARALQDSGAPFEPLLVYLIGDKYYVLDGHHRLDAYHSVQWSQKVPVTVFSGSLKEARSKALELNSRNKLPMTQADKMEAAWELTKTTDLPIAEVNRLSTASKRIISYMRRAWKQLCEQQSYKRIEEMREQLTWVTAKGALHGIKFPTHDDWYNQKVEEITKLLSTHVGFTLAKYPDITADALRTLAPDLPQALIRQWAPQEWETIKELIEEREEELDF